MYFVLLCIWVCCVNVFMFDYLCKHIASAVQEGQHQQCTQTLFRTLFNNNTEHSSVLCKHTPHKHILPAYYYCITNVTKIFCFPKWTFVSVVMDREKDGLNIVRITTYSQSSRGHRPLPPGWEAEAWWLEGKPVVYCQVSHWPRGVQPGRHMVGQGRQHPPRQCRCKRGHQGRQNVVVDARYFILILCTSTHY